MAAGRPTPFIDFLRTLLGLGRGGPPPPPPPPPPAGDVGAQLLEAHDRYRAGRGLPPFSHAPELALAAQKHADLMARRDTMSHQLPGEPDFSARIYAAGYRWSTCAENVAAGERTVAEVMDAWENSPPHRANILGPYADMAGATAVSATGTRYWSVSFATRAHTA